MSNFEFYTPTHVYFGRDTQRQVGDLVRAQGCKKVLVHFGGLGANEQIEYLLASEFHRQPPKHHTLQTFRWFHAFFLPNGIDFFG